MVICLLNQIILKCKGLRFSHAWAALQLQINNNDVEKTVSELFSWIIEKAKPKQTGKVWVTNDNTLEQEEVKNLMKDHIDQRPEENLPSNHK